MTLSWLSAQVSYRANLELLRIEKPEWFDLDKYKCAENLNVREWAHQLSVRLMSVSGYEIVAPSKIRQHGIVPTPAKYLSTRLSKCDKEQIAKLLHFDRVVSLDSSISAKIESSPILTMRFLDIGGSSGENDRLYFIRNAGMRI